MTEQTKKTQKGPKEQVYDEKIYQLMEQIHTICKENNIDFVSSFKLDDDENGNLRCTTALVESKDAALKASAHILTEGIDVLPALAVGHVVASEIIKKEKEAK